MAEEAWARLVRLDDEEAAEPSIVDISQPRFSIGRSPDCNLSFPENKLISQLHCEIIKDDIAVYLADSSTNGTLVDGNRIKHDKTELHHGDDIHIVFKKSGSHNVAYTFQIISKLPNDSVEYTLEYDDMEVPAVVSGMDDEDPSPKRMKLGDTTPDAVEDAAIPPTTTETTATELPARADLSEDTDEVEETLLCTICQEILHDSVSLSPCMHVFCAGCLSKWITSNSTCPTCRKAAKSVAPSHILRNLVDIYLKKNPEKRRPQADIDDLNKANLIKQSVSIFKLQSGHNSDNDYSRDDSGSESSSDNEPHDPPMGIFQPGVFGRPVVPAVPAIPDPSRPMCRECPGYSNNPFVRHTTQTPAALPAATAQPTHQCSPTNQRHMVCYCCLEPFPDRRGSLPTPVSCASCRSMFCHLYWGCNRPACRGCLTLLKDMDFDPTALDNILLSNVTESNILKDYLQSKSLTLKDLVTQVCTKLDSGELQLNNDFGCSFQGLNIKGDTAICYRCGLKALRQMAYYFRRNIPRQELPAAVTSKEDCHWGKNCRTQTKPHHAQRLNHICEQTRF